MSLQAKHSLLVAFEIPAVFIQRFHFNFLFTQLTLGYCVFLIQSIMIAEIRKGTVTVIMSFLKSCFPVQRSLSFLVVQLKGFINFGKFLVFISSNILSSPFALCSLHESSFINRLGIATNLCHFNPFSFCFSVNVFYQLVFKFTYPFLCCFHAPAKSV